MLIQEDMRQDTMTSRYKPHYSHRITVTPLLTFVACTVGCNKTSLTFLLPFFIHSFLPCHRKTSGIRVKMQAIRNLVANLDMYTYILRRPPTMTRSQIYDCLQHSSLCSNSLYYTKPYTTDN